MYVATVCRVRSTSPRRAEAGEEKAVEAPLDDSHYLDHRPADPRCAECNASKATQSPAGRLGEGEGARFLVLDCWPRTCPAWISAPRLWAALVGVDEESGLTRSWLSVPTAGWEGIPSLDATNGAAPANGAAPVASGEP